LHWDRIVWYNTDWLKEQLFLFPTGSFKKLCKKQELMLFQNKIFFHPPPHPLFLFQNIWWFHKIIFMFINCLIKISIYLSFKLWQCKRECFAPGKYFQPSQRIEYKARAYLNRTTHLVSWMGKLQLRGWNLGRVFNFINACVCDMHILCFGVKLANLKLKTCLKKLLDSLPLDVSLSWTC
jgi:hypothetical protein